MEKTRNKNLGRLKMVINENRGIRYETIETQSEIEGTLSFNDKRIVLKGRLALEKMTNSWKFGKQIQIVLFGQVLKIEPRSKNNGFDRIEIAIPFEMGKDLFSKFNKIIENDTKN
jgi:hypothetical protein